MSSVRERAPWRRSLAVRLGLWNAALFGLGATVVLVATYMLVARALLQRELEALDVRAAQLAIAFHRGGVAAVRFALADEQESPHVRSLFVRIVGRSGEVNFAKTPAGWTGGEPAEMPEGWTLWDPASETPPADASVRRGEFAIVSRALPGGIVLQIARSTDDQEVLLTPLRRIMFTAGPAAVLLAVLVGAWLSWRETRPVRQVAATARRIVATGDLSQRVAATARRDEVGELVEQFNTLLERNGALLRAMREALDNVAHDVRTPLTRLRAGAEAALAGRDDPHATREALADCIEETDRIRRLLDTLLDISAAEAGVLPLAREPIDVDRLLQGVGDLYALVAEERELTLVVEPGGAGVVHGDPTRLRQIVANLVDNAVKYTPAGGRVALDAHPSPGGVCVRVSDTGPGVPPAERDKIWRRLYRSDSSRSQRGLGLGLSVVKAVAEAHGGRVAVEAREGGGSVFSVEIPRG